MAELKRIAPGGVAAALDKAVRYRLLNEPREAESICRDVLDVDPANQEALVTLLLALTDQFDHEFADALNSAKEVLARIQGEYEQAYYEGIIHERWAKAQIARRLPGESALGWLRKAMQCYATAERLCTSDDPDAILRWNTCARMIERHDVQAGVTSSTHDVETHFGDEVPPR